MSHEHIAEVVGPLLADYQPNADVQQLLKTVDLITIIGPSWVGKDTVMEASGLHIVKGATDRPVRREEQACPGRSYCFVDTPEAEEQFIDDTRQGNFVQISQHPTTGYFYASHAWS